MSEKTKKQTYELSTKSEMRKGTPDEYKALLQTAISDTSTMVRAAVQESEDPRVQKTWVKSAKIYVPKLYSILIKHEYTPKNARVVILDDCKKVKLWSKDYILDFLPDEAKDQSKAIGGRESAKKRKEQRQQELKQVQEQVKEVLPDATESDLKLLKRLPEKKLRGLGAAIQKTRLEVARSGGEAKRDKYGNEVFSEMGKDGMDIRYGHTVRVEIENDEHKEIVKAYEQSIEMRKNGTGGYILFIKNGEFDKVEPTNGNAEKTVNK